MKKKRKPAKAVHRTLVLASPPPQGADVKLFQSALNRKLKANGFDLKLKLDGQLGARTLYAARIVAYVLGARGPVLRNLKKGRAGQGLQRLVREQRKRSPVELANAARREKAVAKQRAKINSGAKKTVEWALAQVGTTEQPPASNDGPKIRTWQLYWYAWMRRQPWCGAFAGYASKVIGGAKALTGRVVYTPNIVADGSAGANGYRKLVSAQAARPGDHVVFDFDGGGADHVGIFLRLVAGQVETVDGNTSATSAGSQSNGGGVFVRRRPLSTVEAIARPAY